MVLLYAVGAWLILQVADVLVPALALPDWVIRLVAFLLIIGFPLVLAFSWVYELTPEGLKKESEVDREHSITHTTGRKINVLIVLLLVLAIGSVWLNRWLPGKDRQTAEVKTAEMTQTGGEAAQPPIVDANRPEGNTIAVLPFVNMSADKKNEYFSDGLSEELLNLLTRIPELQVASRTSSFSFKGTDAKIEQIASDLKVAHVLEGSVRKSGDTVRITAQLIRADNGYHLWSETYDRTLDDIFAVQDEIAAEVVSALRLTLLNDAPSAAVTSPEVYSLYLQGLYQANQYTAEGLTNAERIIEEAIALDPGYAPAWLELAATLMNQVAQRSREPELAYPRAREAAQRALELDPSNSGGYVTLAWIAMKYDLEFHEAAEYLRKARSMSPNDDVANGIATLHGDLGRYDAAIELYRGMIARDPLSIRARYNLADTYWKAGRAAEAQVEYGQLLRLSPNLKYAELFLGRVELSLGNLDKALAHFQNEPDEAARLQGLLAAHHARGEESASRQVRKQLTEKFSASLPYEVARAIAYTGDANATFELLDKAFEQRSGAMVYSKSEPFFDPVHDDPRWDAWLERLGMSDAQIADIEI
jgi:TolB-like protein